MHGQPPRLSQEDQRRIDRALADARATTGVHLSVVLCESSGRYDRPEDLAGLTIGLTAAALVWLLLPSALQGSDSWAGYTASGKLAWMTVALVVGFAAGATLANRVWSLRRPFTPRIEMRRNVDRASASAYHRQCVLESTPETEAAATQVRVLQLFLSQYERRASLLTEPAVAEAIGQTELDTLCRDLTLLMHGDDVAEAVSQTVRRIAEKCAAPFPPVRSRGGEPRPSR